jgi:hypothetical protein
VEEVTDAGLTIVFDGIGVICSVVWRTDWARGSGTRLVLQRRRVLTSLLGLLESQVVSGEVLRGRGFFEGVGAR